MTKKFSALVIISLCTLFQVQSQDIHFSQYYANPLNLNPALTGNFFGDFRLTTMYRNQAYTISNNPYVTYSGSFDMGLMKKKMRYDIFGVGVVVFSDKAGDGALTTQSAQLSLAYSKTLDAFKKYSLSFGLQGGFLNKRIDFRKLAFESQFDGDGGFDLSLPTGENEANNSIFMPTVTAGVLWKGYFSKKANAYAGFSVAHINQPKQSFLGDNGSVLSRRYTFHAATDFRFGKYVTLTPALLFMSQNTAQQLNIGAALGYDISDVTTFYFGTWYRWRDAIIPMAALEIYGFRVGLSYDANISKLRPASRGQGAVELSLIYIHKKQAPSYFSPANFCPRL